MVQGRGGGRTPAAVVELLRQAVEEKGQSAVAREIGITQSAVHRYLLGIGEPSTATLQKIADHFGTSVEALRYMTWAQDGVDILSSMTEIALGLRALEKALTDDSQRELFKRVSDAFVRLFPLVNAQINKR